METQSHFLTGIAKHSLRTGAEFCRRMVARGEIVKEALKEKRFSVTYVAEKIRISRAQLYNDFSNPEMSFDRIIAIGKVIDYDFSKHFKELSSGSGSAVNEDPAPYIGALSECRDKLLKTQEQLIATMQELTLYKNRYGVTIPD